MAPNGLRGLVAEVGLVELLMTISARPAPVAVAGVLGGLCLTLLPWVSARAGLLSWGLLLVGTLSFAALTWWSVSAPVVAVLALVLGLHVVRVLYVLYAGLRGRTDRRVGIAGAIVAGEVLVFAGNGFRCPLTELAERYGAEHGSVTDIYLRKWFAHTPCRRSTHRCSLS